METLVRRPLQPLNLNSVPLLATLPKKPKKLSQIRTPTQCLIQEIVSKENPPIESSVREEALKPEKRDGELREASLAEELEIVRKRRERLRMEREKTEELLQERDLILESAIKEMERRAEEQNSIELELYKIILLKDLRTSSMRFSPVQSLRMKEEEKKSRALSEGAYSVKSLRQKEEEKKRKETQSEESVSAEMNSEQSSNAQGKGKAVTLQD